MIQASGMVITDKDKELMIDAINAGEISYGKYNKLAETALAEYEGKKKALLVNSGSSANFLALMAFTSRDMYSGLRLYPGAEVITTAAAFPTTVAPIVQAGAVPVFVDIDETYNIDVSQLKRALSKKTKGVMIAHTLGIPFNIDAVRAFCDKHQLFFIADCCDALGSLYKGKPVTMYGDVVTNSFYPAHHITAGEGGAVLTDDPNIAGIVQSLRDWGRSCKCDPGKNSACGKRFDGQFGTLPEGYDHKYVYSHLGYNLKMTNVQAALLWSQLKRIDEYRDIRRANFRVMFNILYEYTFPYHLRDGVWIDYSILAEEYSEPSWFGFPVYLPKKVNRKRVLTKLSESGIDTRLLFAGNILDQPIQSFEYRIAGKLDLTDEVRDRMFWIGCWHGLNSETVLRVAKIVYTVIQEELK